VESVQVKAPKRCSHLKRGKVWDGKHCGGGIRHAAILFISGRGSSSRPVLLLGSEWGAAHPAHQSAQPSSCGSASRFRPLPALGNLP